MACILGRQARSEHVVRLPAADEPCRIRISLRNPSLSATPMRLAMPLPVGSPSGRKPVFQNGKFVGRDIYKGKAHSVRLECVSNCGVGQKTHALLSDFYFQQRALGEWLTSAHVTTAFAQIRYLTPSLLAGIQLGSSDFGSEWQSASADLSGTGVSHKTSALRSCPWAFLHRAIIPLAMRIFVLQPILVRIQIEAVDAALGGKSPERWDCSQMFRAFFAAKRSGIHSGWPFKSVNNPSLWQLAPACSPSNAFRWPCLL